MNPFTTMVALTPMPSASNNHSAALNGEAAFHSHPTAPSQYSIPADGIGVLTLPTEVINHAATLENDEEARHLVISHAADVFSVTRKGRHIAARHHRDNVRMALDAGYRLCARLATLLGEYLEWTVIPGGGQPRTASVMVQITAYFAMGVLAMAADVVLSSVFLLDTAPDRMCFTMVLALVLPAFLSVPLAKGYPLLRHASLEERQKYEQRFAMAFWPAILVLLIAAGFRYTLLVSNPVQAALAGTQDLTDSNSFRWIAFSLQLGAQVIASTAAFCCALRLLHETRKSIRTINPDHVNLRTKLEQETARVQENQDTLGWSDARCEAYDAELRVFTNECLAALGAKRDERRAAKLEIALLRRR